MTSCARKSIETIGRSSCPFGQMYRCMTSCARKSVESETNRFELRGNRMKMVQTTRWDPAEYLKIDEEISA